MDVHTNQVFDFIMKKLNKEEVDMRKLTRAHMNLDMKP